MFASIASAQAALTVSPAQAFHGDQLTCSMNDGGAYVYEWIKNGVHYQTGGPALSHTLSTTVNVGDDWTCKAFLPMGGQVPPYNGITVTVDSAIGTGVVISPQNPSVDDQLTCDVQNGNGNYVYKWYVNGNLRETDTGTTSILN